jgi:enoyl-CoA hydratase
MPNYDIYKEITMEKKDGVGLVTLNRPDHLNAFSAKLHREVEDIMLDINRDDDIRSVVLTGAGRAFSAGGDLEYMKHRDKREESNDVMIGPRRLIHNILTVKQPIIAALNGDAVGVGCTVALFSDVVIMADGARIGDPHVAVGIVAGDGGSVIMPLLVGLNKAKELLLTGELVIAKEALRIGLVN